jgi:hypothetical protein
MIYGRECVRERSLVLPVARTSPGRHEEVRHSPLPCSLPCPPIGYRLRMAQAGGRAEVRPPPITREGLYKKMKRLGIE